VGPRFRKELGNIKGLADSIKKFGLLHPIVVTKQRMLVAGVRRLEACKLLGWDKVPVRFVNLVQIEKGELEENINRENFTPSEMVAIKRFLEPEIKAEAKEREEAGVKADEPCADSAQGTKGKSREKVAKFAGVSHDTLAKAEKVVEAAEKNPEKYTALLKKVDSGKVSINSAYQKVKRDEPREIVPLPSGVFDVVYADPPWKYDVNYLSCSPESHYPTMSTDELVALKVPSAEDAILFLWATNPLLDDALRLMKAWGFSYKTNMVWVKDNVGVGFYFRGQHELLLVGVKGKFHPPDDTKRFSSVLNAPVGEHSEKPERVYEIIEAMYPNSQFLELFARKNRAGWTSWGNEN
jgi:N6-adenosine-specific RNA methylase IME4